MFFFNLILLGYARLNKDNCGWNENPCSRECIKANDKCDQQCNGGNYNCSLKCSGDDCAQECNAKRCNLQCSGKHCVQKCNGNVNECHMHCNASKCQQTCNAITCHLTGRASIQDIPEQKCNGRVKMCNVLCYVNKKNCKQECNAERCNLECNGKECSQICNGGVEGCNVRCNANTCKQTCNAHTCDMTRGGSVNSLTEQKCNSRKGSCCQRILMKNTVGGLTTICDRGKQCTCSKYYSNTNYINLYTSNAIATTSATIIEATTTQTSGTQGDLIF